MSDEEILQYERMASALQAAGKSSSPMWWREYLLEKLEREHPDFEKNPAVKKIHDELYHL